MEQNLPHDHRSVDASVFFWLLCHCEECVINIVALVEMSSPAVSHHLKQLRSGGLITSRREGKKVYYKAADNKQAKLLHRFIEQFPLGYCESISVSINLEKLKRFRNCFYTWDILIRIPPVCPNIAPNKLR